MQLSLETKEAIVNQALGKPKAKMAEIAANHQIALSTLQRWIRATKKGLAPSTHNAFDSTTASRKLDRNEHLEHLLATANLDETAIGAYCRQQGIYAHQLDEWKKGLQADLKKMGKHEHQVMIGQLKRDNKALQQELNRKDKALAETTALLVLKKKAQALWEESEDV